MKRILLILAFLLPLSLTAGAQHHSDGYYAGADGFHSDGGSGLIWMHTYKSKLSQDDIKTLLLCNEWNDRVKELVEDGDTLRFCLSGIIMPSRAAPEELLNKGILPIRWSTCDIFANVTIVNNRRKYVVWLEDMLMQLGTEHNPHYIPIERDMNITGFFEFFDACFTRVFDFDIQHPTLVGKWKLIRDEWVENGTVTRYHDEESDDWKGDYAEFTTAYYIYGSGWNPELNRDGIAALYRYNYETGVFRSSGNNYRYDRMIIHRPSPDEMIMEYVRNGCGHLYYWVRLN